MFELYRGWDLRCICHLAKKNFKILTFHSDHLKEGVYEGSDLPCKIPALKSLRFAKIYKRRYPENVTLKSPKAGEVGNNQRRNNRLGKVRR